MSTCILIGMWPFTRSKHVLISTLTLSELVEGLQNEKMSQKSSRRNFVRKPKETIKMPLVRHINFETLIVCLP